MNYLLDTCVVSDFFKKIPSVIKRFEAVIPAQLHISSLTIMEVEYGLELNPERSKKIRPLWTSLLALIHVVDYSQQCAIASAAIRASLKNEGQLIGPYDILIAGTSLSHNMTMVTSNVGEFSRIPQLTVENWRL